ncbi:MAG: serine/threonine-protein phosphatase [Prevotella sp.]|nr:serine/threonine-protein phosphatase [Prevotella sp.]
MRKLWIFAMIPLLFLMSCGSQEGGEQNQKAENLLEKAHKARNYQLLLTLADSLEATGELSTAKANYWRGYASDRMNRKRMAEFYWKASVEGAANSTSESSTDIYAKSASRLVNLLTVRGDYESALKVAEPAVARLEKLECDSTSDYINLLIYIGCCQAGIGKAGEATSDGFERAYQKHLDNIDKTHLDGAYKDAIAGLINIAYACNTIGNYKEAINWTDKFGKLIGEYEQRLDANSDYIDKQVARFDIYKAIALEKLDEKEEAAKVYEAFKETEFSKTPEGRINANDYLTAAGRWDEAADNYSSLDALLNKQEAGYSIDDIQNLMLKKYQANLLAGRRDSALAVSLQISNALDNAFAQAKKIDEEEQATIVKKVEQMTEQQAEEARNKYYILVAALVGVLLCFLGYIFFRRHGNQKLQEAYEDLQDDCRLLEENTAKKERIETERRIAHSVQENLVPQALPKYPKLGLHALFTPGNGISSDLYDTIIRDDKLYFCVGNAADNSIQTSILANIAWSLFRTAAALEDAPERIMSVINQGIAKEGQINRGVTLFVGILDLKTWVLSYCNAGHDTPLLLLGDEVSPLEVEPNKPVGSVYGWEFIPQETTIAPGTMFFLYSNGLTKVRSKDHKQYGEKRVRGEALQAMKLHPSPEPFIDSMHEAIEKYIGDTPQDYDMTMLVIKR